VEGEPSRWPATIGVLAIVTGAVLMAVSAGNEPPRPRVLGEMLVATTTTMPPRETSGTDAPSTSRAATPRHTTTTHGTATATTSTTQTTPSTSTTPPSSSPPSTSTPTSTTEPCPSGAPAAEVRTWDGGSDGASTWHVTVSGVVTNRTGAAARVGPVAVIVERADGETYVIPADERPVPDPSTVADRGEAAWRWEGDVPAGAAPTGAHAAITEWTWADAPPGCITG
jgi:hypothetical protein